MIGSRDKDRASESDSETKVSNEPENTPKPRLSIDLYLSDNEISSEGSATCPPSPPSVDLDISESGNTQHVTHGSDEKKTKIADVPTSDGTVVCGVDCASLNNLSPRSPSLVSSASSGSSNRNWRGWLVIVGGFLVHLTLGTIYTVGKFHLFQ